MSVQKALHAYQKGLRKEAEQLCQQIIAANPNDADALHIMGCLAMMNGQPDQSRAYFQRALRSRPLSAEIIYNYACFLMQSGSLAEAADQFKLSVGLKPKQPEAWNNMGYCYNFLDRLDEAEAAYRKALEIDPNKIFTWCNLGNLLKDTFRFREALSAYEKAAQIDPKFTGVWRGQMLVFLYMDDVGPDEAFKELTRLGRQMTGNIIPLPQRKRPERPVRRVGWHTSDVYKNHPVARNLAPFFDGEREGLEYYLYLDVKAPDQTTNWFASRSKQAMNVMGVPDRIVAEQIQKDEIDIMIYLAGRLDDNRPQLAAYRPAPINVSMFDADTSGVTGMDYFIVDERMVSSEQRFTEKLVPLPNVYVHDPIPNAPEVAPAPRLTNGYCTFGCFNNPIKIGPRTLAVWQRLLLDVPDAKLLLHYKAVYALPRVQKRILEGLPKIDPARIIFSTGDIPSAGHLARYSSVDVALDPFPINGSTTTFEALHQGVPVIAFTGNTIMSRWSSAMISRVAPELIAEDEEGYLKLARAWATKDVDRQAIRQALMVSPICQPKSTVSDFEAALRAL